MLDKRGNVFFETSVGNSEWVMVRNNAPSSDTSLRVEKRAPGAYTAHFSTPGNTKGGWFSWRVDDKEWSPPTRQSSLTLDFLPTGTHRLEARAISTAGRPDPTPARATLTIEPDSPLRLGKLVQQLGAPNYANREAAIRALARQSTQTLPLLRAALKAARQQNDNDAVWWLEAAIQEAEAKLLSQ
jgi:hypothetical protein